MRNVITDPKLKYPARIRLFTFCDPDVENMNDCLHVARVFNAISRK